MSIKTPRHAAVRGLLAGALVVAALAAQAAAGFSVTKAQESRITPGMSRDEVRQALGRPEQVVKYGNQDGPTWTYEVRDAPNRDMLFDVDFSRDGKVLSSSERLEEPGGN